MAPSQRNRLPDHTFRVTLVNPCDRMDVIACHAIEQLARQLERLVSVRFVRGVDELVCEETADAILCPAGRSPVQMVRQAIGEGQRLVLLLGDAAGIGTLETVPGCEVITPSTSLARAARAAGALPVHIPLGLARDLTADATSMEARGLIITAQTRVGKGNGVEDLQNALVAVREARPDAEIVVFGEIPIDGATQFRLYPKISSVFRILRASAIHVAAAHEDPVSAVGAFSLAAGSALVSTATEGISDYAVPGLTALLTPVGDPDALAANVISLIDDPQLRARIANEGRRYVARLLPTWREVARRTALVLTASR